ncbi:MAG: pyruvate kinase [Candidatus Gastranaerophilales bacterium]|nr:pyruvate kinase [Candidatus Gastranaerophilales bacterium]
MQTTINQGKTKIIATLGPVSSTYEMIKKLAQSGASMFRLNTSHGDIKQHETNLQAIRQVSKELDAFIPVLVDLQGPKIRVANISESISIKEDQNIKLSSKVKKEDIIPIDYDGIADDVKKGDKILIDDGKVGLEVIDVIDDVVSTKVLYGKLIKSRKGINLPGATASLSAVTKRDIDFIKFAVQNNADYIALSFVREAKDIELANKYIQEFGGAIPVIAKIEKPQAIENLDEILKIADGIMVARGDLGIEMSPEDVPIEQKIIIDKATQQRKVCIVATQMLESMIEEPIPTRAEASDVANAIIDGADAVMLSGETAAGKYPIEAVSMMRKIANNTENCGLCLSDITLDINECYDITPQAIANAAIEMAQDLDAKAILAFTHTGYTPRLLAKLRSSVPIIVISDKESTCRRLNLYWGIKPHYREWDCVIDSYMLSKIDEFLYTNTDLKDDDRIIIVGSIPKLISGRTNFIRVHRIGAQDNK